MRHAGILLVFIAAIAVAAVFFQQSFVADLMNVFADGLFERFKDETFPLVLAAAIIVVAIVMLFTYFGLLIWPQASSLRSLRRFVGTYPDPVSFAAAFDEISQKLGNNSLVGHAWKEFEETLVKPDDQVQIVQNTTRPQTFINYSCAQDRSAALRIMPHIPNYFVGVGLLLTFVGLVAALFFANTAVGGNVDDAVEGLQNLLAAATFKFWTSIAGLLSSIVLSFVFRLYALYLEREFGHLCHALERHMGFSTPQRIFVDVRNTIEEQLAETKKINTEVAMSIADGVGQQFREHVPPMLATAMEPLVQAVQESSNKVQEGATGGLENLVNKFATTLEGSTGQHLENMSETLQQLTTSLDAMQGSMDSSGDEFSRRMAEGSERLDVTMRELAESMRSVVEGLSRQVGEAGEAFGISLQESLGRLARQSEAMVTALSEQSRGASAAFTEEITRAAQALSASANENADSSTKFAEQLRESLGESVQGVQGSLDRVGQSLNGLESQLGRQGSELSAVSERSRDTARAMSEASTAINAGLEPFQRIGRSLNETSTSLERSVSGIADKIDAAVSTVETVSTDLSSVSATLQTAWESYRERFENVDEDLERSFTKLQDAVENQQRLVQEFVQGLDQSFDRALSGLSGGIDGINNSMEDLTEQFEKFNGSVRSN